LVTWFLAFVVWMGRPYPSIRYVELWVPGSVTTVWMFDPELPSGSV
jgi:hypothetical protein